MKSLTISRKIALGFAALIHITGMLGGFAVSSMRSVQTSARTLATEFVPEVDVSHELQTHLASSQLAIRSYGFTAESAYVDEARKAMVAVQKDVVVAQKLAAAHPNLVKLRADLGQIVTTPQNLRGGDQRHGKPQSGDRRQSQETRRSRRRFHHQYRPPHREPEGETATGNQSRRRAGAAPPTRPQTRPRPGNPRLR